MVMTTAMQKLLGEQDTLTGEEVVQGFSCRVGKLFS
jgi:hypothetical protein